MIEDDASNTPQCGQVQGSEWKNGREELKIYFNK